MELILKNDLPHQSKGYQGVANVFSPELLQKSTFYYENPKLVLDKPVLQANIKNVQKENKVSPDFYAYNQIQSYLNLDVKMETGTGKTYVYTAAMYELHKRFGINKFIVVVPTLAIKAGAKQFMEDPYVKRHFKDTCGYDAEIDLLTLEALKKKKGKQFFPSTVREFVSGSSQIKNKIYVILTNMSLLGGTSKLLTEQYDYGVEGFYKPTEAIAATKPFIIIDEPHRFNKEQKAWQFIETELKPQAIFRFGATFPDISVGRGKNKQVKKDYQNLLYDLNAFEAFNQNLIKGISKEHLQPLSNKEDKVKIMSVASKTSAKFNLIQKDKASKTFDLGKGDSLGIISPELGGISIDAVGNSFIELSNGQIKSQGEEFSTDIYSSSYQESMLRLALERHFQTERENFNRAYKIKTLALFFIDDIHSYRNEDNSEKEPYLKNIFEKLLLEKIDSTLQELSEQESDYKDFLMASKKDISATHAGYFSQDNNSSDEAIGQEINEILYEKKKLLSIVNNEGDFVTRRFLFSKWTLKEGWDNPNVFTIAKLRSSGSENSKIQEVGRGLRLPVDENGNRISNEEFKLNYIIDFTEADFAEKLVKEINSDLPNGFAISDEQLEAVANKLEITKNELFKKLLLSDFIDMDKNILPENTERFFEEYPEFNIGLDTGKVVDRNKKPERKLKIRKAVFDELKTLWQEINKKYILFYDKIEEDDYLHKELVAIFQQGIFADVYISSIREDLDTSKGEARVMEDAGMQYKIKRKIAYHEFLARINRQTNLPIRLIHQALLEYSKTHVVDGEKINELSAANFVRLFHDWKLKKLEGRFSYSKTQLNVLKTALTYSDGTPIEEISQGRVGTKITEGTPVENIYMMVMLTTPH